MDLTNYSIDGILGSVDKLVVLCVLSRLQLPGHNPLTNRGWQDNCCTLFNIANSIG